nr:PREDICTED: uncharacterized protein LOC102363758 [Latimeria chalumnae]|eukprot:XP_005995755.1 PREDICTED: uncharacterized protein LOC102363758 [Latimeria chalumnae]
MGEKEEAEGFQVKRESADEDRLEKGFGAFERIISNRAEQKEEKNTVTCVLMGAVKSKQQETSKGTDSKPPQFHLLQQLQCPFCYQLLKDPFRLPCRHDVCRTCLQRSSSAQFPNLSCPRCRSVCRRTLERRTSSLLEMMVEVVESSQKEDVNARPFCSEGPQPLMETEPKEQSATHSDQANHPVFNNEDLDFYIADEETYPSLLADIHANLMLVGNSQAQQEELEQNAMGKPMEVLDRQRPQECHSSVSSQRKGGRDPPPVSFIPAERRCKKHTHGELRHFCCSDMSLVCQECLSSEDHDGHAVHLIPDIARRWRGFIPEIIDSLLSEHEITMVQVTELMELEEKIQEEKRKCQAQCRKEFEDFLGLLKTEKAWKRQPVETDVVKNERPHSASMSGQQQGSSNIYQNWPEPDIKYRLHFLKEDKEKSITQHKEELEDFTWRMMEEMAQEQRRINKVAAEKERVRSTAQNNLTKHLAELNSLHQRVRQLDRRNDVRFLKAAAELIPSIQSVLKPQELASDVQQREELDLSYKLPRCIEKWKADQRSGWTTGEVVSPSARLQRHPQPGGGDQGHRRTNDPSSNLLQASRFRALPEKPVLRRGMNEQVLEQVRPHAKSGQASSNQLQQSSNLISALNLSRSVSVQRRYLMHENTKIKDQYPRFTYL